MSPLLVVIPFPGRNLPSRVKQVAEPASVQALIAQFAVRAFHVPVLHQPAWFNITKIDSSLNTPSHEMPGGELRPIVAPDALWPGTVREGNFEHASHSAAGETSIHF